MEQYFIMQENRQQGPFDLEELALKKLKEDTLVWYEGLKKWKKAYEIDELKILFISKGIPLFITDFNFSPKQFGYKVQQSFAAKKHTWQIVAGVIALLAVVIWILNK